MRAVDSCDVRARCDRRLRRCPAGAPSPRRHCCYPCCLLLIRIPIAPRGGQQPAGARSGGSAAGNAAPIADLPQAAASCYSQQLELDGRPTSSSGASAQAGGRAPAARLVCRISTRNKGVAACLMWQGRVPGLSFARDRPTRDGHTRHRHTNTFGLLERPAPLLPASL